MRSYLLLLRSYLPQQKFQLAALFALVLAGVGLQLVVPQILRRFIDGLETFGAVKPLVILALTYIALTLAQQITSLAARYLSVKVGWKLTNSLRSDLFAHLLRLDLDFFSRHTAGDLVTRVDGDAQRLSRFLSTFSVNVVSHVLLIIGICLVVALEDLRMGFVFLAVVLIALVAMSRFPKLSGRYWGVERQKSVDLGAGLEDMVSAAPDLRRNDALNFAEGRLRKLQMAQFKAYRSADVASAMAFGSARLVVVIALLAALMVSVYLFRQNAFTLGVVFLFLRYAQLISNPLQAIGSELQELQVSAASIRRIEELLSVKATITDGPITQLGSSPPELAFKGLSFAYSTNAHATLTLKDINFKLEAGSVLGVIGRTGSGKSTIAKLVARLYEPESGSITLNGTDLRQFSLHTLRQNIGYVDQDVQLFRASLRENIRLFDQQVTDEGILQALADLSLTAWLETLPAGLDTQMHPEQQGLSTGEAQLISLTRLFLRNPSLVILDEATAHLDAVTESHVQNAIASLVHNRTAVVIAHRLATLETADSIAILELGNLIEYGSRETLAADPTSVYSVLLANSQSQSEFLQ